MKTQAKTNGEWKIINGETCLYFTFEGILDVETVKQSIQKFELELLDADNQKINLVYNCLAMKDWEPLARLTGQNSINHYKDNIKEIWVICDSQIIKIGANLISTFTPFNIQVVSTEAQLFK